MLPQSTSISLLLTIVITPLSLTRIIAPPLCNNDFEGISALGSVYNQYQPVICNATFNTPFSGNVNNSLEYIFVFPYNKAVSLQPRVTVESKSAVHSRPLLVVVTQLTSILSWQVPLEDQNSSGGSSLNRVSRTLCPEDDQEEFIGIDDIVITISTRNNESVDFVLWVNDTQHFNVEPSKLYKIQVSTTEPQFFKFTFDNNMSSALIVVESADTSCMTLSIQNNSCPVYDLEGTVQYRGLWQTVISKGGIFLRKEEFPLGMFIVFVVHNNKADCTQGKGFSQGYQTKEITFQIETSIGFWDYVIAVTAVLGTFLTIYIVAGCFILWSNRRMVLNQPMLTEGAFPAIGPGWSSATSPTTPMSFGGGVSDESDISETDVDMLYDADTSKEIIRAKKILFLSDLAQKDPRILSVKSKLYLWNMITVAVFYALPVVQLVFSYQQVSIQSGNQDLCYYNFLCSHRLGYWSDFNHVFSNIGYLLFGLLFLGLTWRRQRLNRSVGSHLGIPYHYGLFYALGFALCMEGVLSACYHLCPNHSNFQFDTSFMYVIAVLTMIKIYQTRHPDITASAYTTFGALAFVIFLGMFGVLNGSSWFYVVFTVAHLLTCFFITAQIYHMGSWKLDLGMFQRFAQACKNDYIAGGLTRCCRPLYPTRMLLLFLANVGNWGLVAIGYYLHLGDFATYMLSIFLANLLMYFIFYIVMKIVCNEKILILPSIYIVMATLLWSGGMYFFYHKSISWKKTPAESRAYNQPCVILNFYDKHDIWHFLSAGALFFSFMVLLTLDDDIAELDRRLIPVF